MNDYARIEKAMAFMVANATQQPSLETVAAQVHLSAFHFQRLFCRYAGVSPKRFLQALTLARGKQLIASAQSLSDTAHALGLSGGSRLYDHFVTLEAVTPGEFKRQGEGVEIVYGIHPTPFGEALVAATPRGICRMGFLAATSEAEMLAQLAAEWPCSTVRHQPEATRYAVDALFEPGKTAAPGGAVATRTRHQFPTQRMARTADDSRRTARQLFAHCPGARRANSISGRWGMRWARIRWRCGFPATG